MTTINGLSQQPDSEQEQITGLYRHFVQKPQPGDNIPRPEYNYSGYQLLSFKSRLRVLVKLNFGSEYEVILHSVKHLNNMHQKVEIYRGRYKIDLVKQQRLELARYIAQISYQKLDTIVIIPKIDLSYYNKTIPRSWVSGMLPFMEKHLDLKIKSISVPLKTTIYGLEADLSRFKLTNTDKSANHHYSQYHNSLVDAATTSLYRFYWKGYIANPGPDIVSKWQLTLIDEALKIYQLKWQQPRIISYKKDPVSFIMMRMISNKWLSFYVGSRASVRHQLAETALKRYRGYFNADHIYLQIDSLVKAADVINDITNFTTGLSCFAFKFDRADYSRLVKKAKEMKLKYTYYQVLGLKGLAYYFSICVDVFMAPQLNNIAFELQN